MKGLPLLHITDLYHPPQDPDDHLDLATIASLGEFDLKGVVLDATQRFLDGEPEGSDMPRDPGFVPVAQLGYLLGRSIPAAMGPLQPLSDPGDDCRDRPRREQAGINLILDTLEASQTPVIISCVGSARALTAAFNRAPNLVREKTRSVLLNAGSTTGSKQEWNVGLDPAAYIGLWCSGLPVHWYPCATGKSAFDPLPDRGTYWRSTHAALFNNLPRPLLAWFAHAYGGSARGDIIRALQDQAKGAVWDIILSGSRHIWSTASLVMAAGRELVRLPEGWRFVQARSAEQGVEKWPMRLDPINATVTREAVVKWTLSQESTGTLLFGRQEGAGYGQAMAEALNALLQEMPV